MASQTARGAAPYVSAGTAFSGTYGYGNAGRLTKANVGVGAGALTGGDVKVRDVDYCYDSVDKEQVAALKVANVNPNATPCAGAVYASYMYDAAGNQIQRAYPAGSPAGGGSAETFDYVYDGEDRLRRVTKKVSGVVTGSEEYWYDEQGARVGVLKRGPTGTKEELRWFIGDTQAHYDAAGVVTKVYSHLSLGTPIARVERTGNANSATSVEYQFHGLASNMLAVVASDGVVNANMAYAPYGELIEGQQASAAVGLPAHRRRMNDKYVDELGGLAYYGARHYDNVLIGWTQADPKYRFAPDAAWKEPRRGNLYMFTLGNPVRYLDPDGKDPRATYKVSVQSTVDPNAKDLRESNRAILAAVKAMPSGQLAKALADRDIATCSNCKITSNDKHSTRFVIVDSADQKSVAAAGKISAAHAELARDVKTPGVLGSSRTPGSASVLDARKFADTIAGIKKNGGGAKEIATAARNFVNHEASHNLGLTGNNYSAEEQKTDEAQDDVMNEDLTNDKDADYTTDDLKKSATSSAIGSTNEVRTLSIRDGLSLRRTC